MGFENGVSAGMQTSWLSPFKEHRLTVTGTAGSLVFDDTKPWPEKLTLFQDQMRLNGEHFIIDRASPITLPVPEAEPLKDEMRAFIKPAKRASQRQLILPKRSWFNRFLKPCKPTSSTHPPHPRITSQ